MQKKMKFEMRPKLGRILWLDQVFSIRMASMGLSLRSFPTAYIMDSSTTANTLPLAMRIGLTGGS